jgi:hypothetical protein
MSRSATKAAVPEKSAAIANPPSAVFSRQPGRARRKGPRGGAPVMRLSALRPSAVSHAPQGVAKVLASSGGAPLTSSVRQPLEESLGVDLEAVRIHQAPDASALVDTIGARAFAIGPHIFLGRREQQTDLGLLAHEVAHVVQQQGGGAGVQAYSAGGSADPLEREAQSASTAVVSGEPAQIQQRTPPRPQFSFGDWVKSGISAVADVVGDIAGMALDFIRDKARMIPGYDMAGFILGRDPITQKPVTRNAVNLIKAVMGLWPGGTLVFDALQSHGIIDKVGGWLEQQLSTLVGIIGGIRAALDQFIKTLGPADALNLTGAWGRAKRIFEEPIDRASQFVRGLVTSVLGFIRDAILMPIAKLAENTRGYPLLKAVLGKDPVTGQPAAQDAATLIGGFMKLIGEEEIWENMQKANAVPRAFAWFKTAMAELKVFVAEIPPTFINAFKSLEVVDMILVPRAFAKIASAFGNFIGRFLSWAGGTIWTLLEIIFESVKPGALEYVKKTGAALKSILKNPMPFVGNLIKAAKRGFEGFADRFGDHLKAGLIDWLLGALPGVYIPKAFALGEIVKFVFSVLGLTWQNLRAKLVAVLGETVVKAMETGFKIVVTLVRDGPAAAWEEVKSELANLKDQIIEGIIGMVVDTIIKKAVPKLIAMFIPGAGFISAILSIYETVMVFVNKLAKIVQVIKGFIDSIVNIAAGQIDAASKKVETILAGLLSLAISFLAGFLGLGNVADKIMGVIKKVRAVIDKALDAMIKWIVKMAKAFVSKAKGAISGWLKATKPVNGPGGQKHTLLLQGEGKNAKLIIKSTPTTYLAFVNALKTTKDKSTALKLAGKVDTAITAAAQDGAPADAGTKVEAAMAALAEATIPLLPASMKSTPPIFGGLVGTFGSSATVLMLTSDSQGGGEPSKEDGAWQLLRKRLDGKGTYYVRGHLLNHNLGGPGNTWANLTPLTQNANNRAKDSMLKLFEKPIKDATTAGDAINFAVTASYGRSHPLASQVATLKGSSDPDEQLVGKIIEAEKFVPQSLSCKGSQIDASGKVGKAVGQMTVDNVIQTREEDYFLTAGSKKTLNVNTASASDLKQLFGIDAATANKIASKKGSYSEDQDVMDAGNLTWAQWKAARETPRIRVRFK